MVAGHICWSHLPCSRDTHLTHGTQAHEQLIRLYDAMEAPNAREGHQEMPVGQAWTRVARPKRDPSKRHSSGGLGSWDRLGGLARSPCLPDATGACGSKDKALWLKEGAQELEMREQGLKVHFCACACVHVCMRSCINKRGFEDMHSSAYRQCNVSSRRIRTHVQEYRFWLEEKMQTQDEILRAAQQARMHACYDSITPHSAINSHSLFFQANNCTAGPGAGA